MRDAQGEPVERNKRVRHDVRRPTVRRVLSLLLVALLASICGTVLAAPQVEMFSPQGSVKAVRQVTARFSELMVAFGDPRLPAPFTIDCAASGRARWAEGRNWVYDFDADMAAGQVCRFTLKADTRSLAGEAFADFPVFSFDTGGPAIRTSLPGEGDSSIDADQIFILALDAPAEAASVAAHASCTIANLAERVPLDILSGDERAAVLAQRRALGDQYFSILWKSGRQSIEKVKREDLQVAEQQLVVARCHRQLPPDSDVRLIWGAGISTTSGIATALAQSLAFHTRAAFNVRVECERVNARANCLPLLPVRVLFSAPVPLAQAMQLQVLIL